MQVGSRLRLHAEPGELVVTAHLGAGGEGDVFAVADDTGASRYALKWYHARVSSAQRRANLAALVERGAPSDAFLWPLGLVEDPAAGRFGYLMRLRPDEYVGLSAVLRGDVARNERAVLEFGHRLARAFVALHTRGLCYRDINLGNAFMEPSTGDVLVCDNDNVGIEGVSPALVLGSRRFMAPEIVRGEALPSKATDRYSLAVLLFLLLMAHHPLEGRRTEFGLADNAADLAHFGYDPRFCFDPDDDVNRPDPTVHPFADTLWRLYPSVLRDRFVQAFTTGLHEPDQRVVDAEWVTVLARLRDASCACPVCPARWYLDRGRLAATCGYCGSPTTPVTVLGLPSGPLVVVDGVRVTGRHLGTVSADPLGTVERHPVDPTRLGLRNDSAQIVDYAAADGTTHQVPPGRRAALDPGARLVIEGVTVPVELVHPDGGPTEP